jgi:hypothetical protein
LNWGLNSSQQLVFRWDTVLGQTYWLEFRESLEAGSWTKYSAETAATGTSLSLVIPMDSLRAGYFRIRVQF